MKSRLVMLFCIATFLAVLSGTGSATAQIARVPILLYHHIDNRYGLWHVKPEKLEMQLQYLSANGYHTVSTVALVEAREKGTPLPDNPIILTFDDGYQDAYDTAFPLLLKYHMTGTFYIVSGVVGEHDYMSWTEIKKLQQAGMEIGAHTVDHPFLTQLPSLRAFLEILLSRLQLSWHLDQAIMAFAYPYNDHNSRIINLAKLAGFQNAVIVSPHTNDNINDPFEIPRITILPAEGMKTFAFVIRADNLGAPAGAIGR